MNDILSSTEFIPCPYGFFHPETYRVFEALECGCIPIVESAYDYYEHVFPNNPFLKVNIWKEAKPILQGWDRDQIRKKLSDKKTNSSELKFLEANYLMHDDRLDLAFEAFCEANNKKLISAAKQCNSLFLPKINPIISLDQFLLNTKNKDNKFFADLESKNKLNKSEDNINSLLIIGPEGDFTNEEKEKIKQSGYNSISLGNQILRSETAAVVGGYLLSEN